MHMQSILCGCDYTEKVLELRAMEGQLRDKDRALADGPLGAANGRRPAQRQRRSTAAATWLVNFEDVAAQSAASACFGRVEPGYCPSVSSR